MLPTAQQTPALAFSLLGRFELRLDGRELRSLPRKARALLAYLAMQEGKSVPREALADLLWTDRGVEQARHSLRQTLLVLRRELGAKAHAAMRSDERMLSLDPAAVSVDALQFRGMGGATDRAALEAAAALYRGPLMEGLPAVSRDFDAWLETTREAFADGAIDMLGRLADACAATRDWDQAIQSLERMLALDPLREDVHRRLIEMCGRAGRRSEALRHYKACVDLLRRELNVAPAPETEALVRRIQAERASPDVAPVLAAARPTQEEGPPSIAVLPFRNLGPDAVPTYLSEGLVTDTVAMLSAVREPVVISASSSLAFRDRPFDLNAVRTELGIRYAVSGTIRRAGDRMRIFVELADAVTANVLWARSYDAENMHLFDAQDSIVGQIVNTLVPRMQSAELARTRAKRPESLTAYDLVLQARDLVLRLEPASFERAGELLQQAIALDPGYAAGHAALAAWYSLRIGQGWSADPDREARALDSSAQAALACDRFNAQALALLGHNRTILDLEHDRAQELFSRAIDAAPNDASVWTWSSPTAAFIGDGPEAVRRAERALRLSPLDPFLFRIHHFLCIAHYTSGTYEDAVHWGMLSLRDAPHYTSSLRATAAALAALGRLDEAQEVARRAIDLQPKFRVSSILQRHPYRDPEMRRRYAQDLSSAGLLA